MNGKYYSVTLTSSNACKNLRIESNSKIILKDAYCIFASIFVQKLKNIFEKGKYILTNRYTDDIIRYKVKQREENKMYNLDQIKKYNRIGIRGLANDEQYNVGDTCRKSYDWNHEMDCSSFDTENKIELNGTCAVDSMIDVDWDDDNEIVEKLNKVICNFGYAGNVVIIGGNSAEYGQDENEIIIEDAIVLQVL